MATAVIFFRRSAVLFAIAVMLGGCSRSAPVYNVTDHAMPEASRSLSLQQIEDRIITAGKPEQWQMRPEGSGTLVARREWGGGHAAIVTIRFSQQTFSIRYKATERLLKRGATSDGADAQPYLIHRKYNKVVKSLERHMEIELAKPAS